MPTKSKRKKKAVADPDPIWRVPEYEALIMWLVSEAVRDGKVELQVAFGDTPGTKIEYKSLKLVKKLLPPIDSVRIPKLPDWPFVLEESN